jgi:hypothetical protein
LINAPILSTYSFFHQRHNNNATTSFGACGERETTTFEANYCLDDPIAPFDPVCITHIKHNFFGLID